MTLTTDRDNPNLKEIQENGQQKAYIVLSDEEKAKGYVKPVRHTYYHVGLHPKYALRDLTPEEQEQWPDQGYVKFEEYPESEAPHVGRFWTKKDLHTKACGTSTKIALSIAETYARDPKFYGGTFCVHCGEHFPVDEFIWEDGEVVGS